jgi:transcriptional regulator with XRE-family HTH domain
MVQNEEVAKPVDEKDINKCIGAAIRTFRLERRVQQKVIATHLNITAQQFQHMEHGDCFVSAARLLLINRFMGVSAVKFNARLHRKIGMRNELFRRNVYTTLADGLVADFLSIPSKRTSEAIRVLIRDCAVEEDEPIITNNIEKPG